MKADNIYRIRNKSTGKYLPTESWRPWETDETKGRVFRQRGHITQHLQKCINTFPYKGVSLTDLEVVEYGIIPIATHLIAVKKSG